MPFCKAVAERYGWTLPEVKQLTIRQLIAYISPTDGGHTRKFATDEEYRNWQTQQI